jgi:hypothetical protein
MATTLNYYIFEGILVGSANSQSFHLSAASGGGGGSKKKPVDFGGGYYPYLTGQKTTGSGAAHQHGGPIPIGKYSISKPVHHAHLGLSAFLVPAAGNDMLRRGGFFIHGRGSHGSDGCIVPLSSFGTLMDALKADPGGTLIVMQTTGGSAFA